MVDEALLDMFVRTLETTDTINLPGTADKANLSWFDDVLPRIKSDPAFRLRVERALERTKFVMLDKLMQCGLYTKIGRNCEPAQLRLCIAIIDSGSLFGEDWEKERELGVRDGRGVKEAGASEGAAKPVMSEEQKKVHMKRLHLVEDVG